MHSDRALELVERCEWAIGVLAHSDIRIPGRHSSHEIAGATLDACEAELINHLVVTV